MTDVYLTITTAFSTWAGIVGVLPAVLSLMFVPATGKIELMGALVYLIVLSFPLVCYLSVKISWSLYGERDRLACVVASVPPANIVMLGLIFHFV